MALNKDLSIKYENVTKQVYLALLSGCRARDQLGKKNFHLRFNLIKFEVDFKRLLLLLLLLSCSMMMMKLKMRMIERQLPHSPNQVLLQETWMMSLNKTCLMHIPSTVKPAQAQTPPSLTSPSILPNSFPRPPPPQMLQARSRTSIPNRRWSRGKKGWPRMTRSVLLWRGSLCRQQPSRPGQEPWMRATGKSSWSLGYNVSMRNSRLGLGMQLRGKELVQRDDSDAISMVNIHIRTQTIILYSLLHWVWFEQV